MILFSFSTLPGFAASEPFFWGVGHSAFQVEGSPGRSDWSMATETPGRIADGTNANRATDFWNDPDKDFELAQQLGSNMFRLSVAWERIEPKPGQWDENALAQYEKIILGIRKRGMEPLVTLHHFVLPDWMADKGGINSEDFSNHFAQFSMKVVRRLAIGPAQVKWWMTINEPAVLVTGGYILGEWPPFKKSFSESRSAIKNLSRAHNVVTQLIRNSIDLPRDLKVSIAYHWTDIQAEGFGLFNGLIAKIGDYFFNRYFLDSVAINLDYLGMNYYGRKVVRLIGKWPFFSVDEGQGKMSDLNWVIYPEGLGRSLKDAFETYQLPILIAENGVADASDSLRAEFLRTHVAQIQSAKSRGIPVIGYLHWSLTDNFEWARGLTPRFGLVEVNHKTGERKPRPSFRVFQDIIKAGL
jgi:beta-glucosidase